MIRLGFAGVVVAALLGLAEAAQVPKGTDKPEPYFPTMKGAKSVFDAGGVDFAEVVTGVEEKDGAKLVALSLEYEGTLKPSGKVMVSDKGLLQVDRGGKPLTTPTVLLKLPHKPGQTWETAEGDKVVKMTAHGPEQVETPAGRFEAIRVEWEVAGKPFRTMWVAPGVGPVQVKDGSLFVLKSFTPGKP